jgi:hypothetical protein
MRRVVSTKSVGLLPADSGVCSCGTAADYCGIHDVDADDHLADEGVLVVRCVPCGAAGV